MSQHTLLPGSTRQALPGATVKGPVRRSQSLEIDLLLRRKAALPPLEGRPKVALTHEELEAKHGASEKDIQVVSDTLAGLGLKVLSANPATRQVRVKGSAEAIEKAFHVRLFDYAHERGDYRGRSGDIYLPAALEGVVEGVFGLDTRPVVKKREGLRSVKSVKAVKAATRPYFFPSELAQIYQFPQGDGAGQTVALLEFGGGYFPADLAAFLKLANITTSPTVLPISVDKTPTNKKDGAEGEVLLDIEVVAGIIPKAKIAVYFGHFSEQGWINTLNAAIHDQANNASVISISWGYAEDYPGAWTPAAIAAVNDVFHAAALLGKTVFVAAGDDGSGDGVQDGHAHVDFPASSQYVVAVGGTSVKRSGTKITEKVWKDGTGIRPQGGSTGGGVSLRIARPSWQNLQIPSVNPGGFDGRIVPDVAADASAETGYVTVVDGKPGVTGGTSAAAPLWAALAALLNSQLPKGKTVGYLTPLLYQNVPGGTLGSVALKDITSGDNKTAAVGGYSAGSGFDAVTGWGAPNGTKLLDQLKKLA